MNLQQEVKEKTSINTSKLAKAADPVSVKIEVDSLRAFNKILKPDLTILSKSECC